MRYTNLLKSTLSQKGFWQINKVLLRALGIEAALLLTDLVDKWIMYDDNNQLDKDGCFFNTAKAIQKDTTLSSYQQRRALKILVSNGVIYTDNKTVGNRSRFRIEENQLINLLNLRIEETKHLEINKIDNSYNNNKETIIKNNNKDKEKKFIKKENENSGLNLNDNENKTIKVIETSLLNAKEATPQKEKKIAAQKKKSHRSWTLQDLKDEVYQFLHKYPKNRLDEFIEYWSESNGKQMRVNKCDMFETSKRLSRWFRNNFDKSQTKPEDEVTFAAAKGAFDWLNENDLAIDINEYIK